MCNFLFSNEHALVVHSSHLRRHIIWTNGWIDSQTDVWADAHWEKILKNKNYVKKIRKTLHENMFLRKQTIT